MATTPQTAAHRPGDDGVCAHEGESCSDPERCRCFCEDCAQAYENYNEDEEESGVSP